MDTQPAYPGPVETILLVRSANYLIPIAVLIGFCFWNARRGKLKGKRWLAGLLIAAATWYLIRILSIPVIMRAFKAQFGPDWM